MEPDTWGVTKHNMLIFIVYSVDICCKEKLICPKNSSVNHPTLVVVIVIILVLLPFKHLHQPEVFY